ncbi:MAG: rod shape-determining protein MreB [Thermotogaceae bacterium]|nr:rod shape-determining protein MreB [Thermotogaceae bacterium]
MKNDYLFFDLGTQNIRIFSSNNGLIFHGPGAIALNDEFEVIAYGNNAMDLQIGEEIRLIYPIEKGTVANHHVLHLLLQAILAEHYKKRFGTKVKAIFSIPPFATNVEQRAYFFVGEALEFSQLLFIPEFIFLLTSIYESIGNYGFEFVAQTGAGRMDTYLLNNGKLLYGDSLKGGFEFIVSKLLKKIRFEKGIQIGRKSLFEAFFETNQKDILMRGRNKVTGEAVDEAIEVAYLEELLKEGLADYVQLIKAVFEQLSPDLSAEFLEKGLRLSGGPSNEKWLRDEIEKRTGFSVKISDTPGEDILKGFKVISNHPEREQLERYNLLGTVIEVR